MEKLIEGFKSLTENSALMTLIVIVLTVYLIYSKVKYACLKKASEMVAEAETYTDLTGEQKFALVMLWINDTLPGIFRNKLFQTIISNLIEFAYNNAFSYAKNYIQRKTGYDISELVECVKSTVKEVKEEMDKEETEKEEDNSDKIEQDIK